MDWSCVDYCDVFISGLDSKDSVDSTVSSTSASFIAPKEKLQCFRTIGQDELNNLSLHLNQQHVY